MSMRKFLFAPILTVVMVAMVILGANFFTKTASAEPDIQPVASTSCTSPILGLQVLCAQVVGDRLVVKALNGQVLVDQPLPKVTLSGPTIRVTLPRVTVTRPPVTVTLPRVTLSQVTLPGRLVTLPRQTVTVELPRATDTATVRLPGQTVTAPPIPGQTATVSAPTVVPVTVTAPNGQKIQTSVTITPSPLPGTVTTKPVTKEREVRVSVPQAIAYGIGALLLGLILGLLAIYVAYAVGYKDSEDVERTRWQNFRDELFGKKDEGDK